MDHVARVARASPLHQEALHLVVGDGAVFDAAWDDEDAARRQVLDVVAELHAERPAQRNEELVLVGVRVPHELALETRDLDLVVVQGGEGSRAPVFENTCERRAQINGSAVHDRPMVAPGVRVVAASAPR